MTDKAPGTMNVVAGSRPWNLRVFDERLRNEPGSWAFVGTPAELTDLVAHETPRTIFFLHWSWRVPDDIIDHIECINFHMTDVPYGRGGSPLQNLITRGHRTTMLSAIRMTSEMDAGPVYLKRELDLGGTAEDVYIRASELAAEMIAELVREPRAPQPQVGEPTLFTRRRPQDSEIAGLPDLRAVHDHIRMLDADGYPPAFLEADGFRYKFRRAAYYNGRVLADVEITRLEEDDK